MRRSSILYRVALPATFALSLALTASTAVAAQGIDSKSDLSAGIPEPAGEFMAEDAIHEVGRRYLYVSEMPPGQLIFDYGRDLQSAGWEVLTAGGDDDLFGGGAGRRSRPTTTAASGAVRPPPVVWGDAAGLTEHG